MNFLSRCILTCLSLFCVLSTAFAQQNGRKRESFNEGWKFHLGHAADATKDFNYGLVNIFAKSGKTDSTAIAPAFNDTGWKSLQLPHDWAIELPFENRDNENLKDHGFRPVGGLFPQNSIGWYRKSFAIAAADSGRRFSITFDGVFRDAKVWINGFYLGGNESGYVGFTRDITDYMSFKTPNVMVVRVDATQAEGWFYEGAGIYRNVWLNSYDNLHIADDVFVHTDVKGNAATVTLEATIENQGLTAATGSFYANITDRNGKLVGKTQLQNFTIGQSGRQLVKQQLMINAPQLWSIEQPYLYHIKPIVSVNGKQTDSRDIHFGVRTIEIKPDGVFLNGKHVKIKGTNNHQDHAGLGAALPDYLQYYRIALLKQFGSNAYRTSHHAPTPELLDACDSLGMLVLDEQRLLNSSPEYMDQFERLLKRDRNHASVFLWSIGNEEGYAQTNSYGKRIAQTLLAKQRELDPTRTSTYAADLANVFTGVNEVIPVRGFNYRQTGVADYHKDHPGQPIIGTEMGSTLSTRGIYVKDTVRAYLPDQDISAPWWASRAEEWWPLAATNSYWLGGFIWTGFDYRGEPTPYKWPNVNSHFGVMDVCGFPKNLYYYYQSWWKDEDVLHLSPHWNWPGKQGQIIPVWVNTNADDVELFLNGKSLGKKIMPRNSHLQWDVAYQPGVLKAVATRNGKKINGQVKTTGAAYKIKLSPSKNVLLADGRDAVVVNVSVVDKNGLEVPDALNMINFSSLGDARIIGVGNGDPSSHEADQMDGNWQRSLFNGYCQLIIRAGKTAGNVVVKATSPGLMPGQTGLVLK
ncbi:beta-galactosidase GalA [Mucilaginibacter phyllosphaerae]|nr:beta-galactosidase GalA [Mucilaginibacter phyllosphaerae]MBB3969181.1 beta-galactosidase [Mucilaginibacter phyllosphaerae]GGH06839.1 beta-galactosidase [Mucilaginibacter phyllosphaerae]